MIPVLITSILTVCYFLSIALVYKAIVSGKSDLTIFYLIFPIALPFFGAGLIHMISKPNLVDTVVVKKQLVAKLKI
ncbi:MAG: hypothetical protein ACLSFK_04080 [Streptococcus salivarius]